VLPDDDTAGAPRRPARIWAGLVEGMAALGTLMIAGLMAMICADIVARNGFGGSLPLVSELGALTLVMIVALQLATTVRHGRLARIELASAWLARRRPRLATGLAALWDLAGAAAFGAIAWSTAGILARDFAHLEYIGVTGVATLPTWPFRAVILAGFAVAAIQFGLRALAGLRQASLGQPAA
jgi:TRAP-type C4-dicarboxylate transport system permease small subunit